MVTRGIQCSLLEPPCESEEDEEDMEDDKIPTRDEKDPTWLPQDHPMDCESDEEDEEKNSRNEVTPTGDKKFIVFQSQLLQLFSVCPLCCSETSVRHIPYGTLVTIFQNCQSCDFNREWRSQPFIGSFPAGNILLSAAILFTGSLPAKVLTLFNHFGLSCISRSTFFKHQREILHPAVESVWKQEQEAQFELLRDKESPLVLGGDGRADTPGHNAKFGSYSMMDLETKKVLHVELVQSNEVKNSNAMEKEGFIRSVKHIEDKGLTVGTLITDRHPQIQKLVRETMTSTRHFYDAWHVAKGLRKKLEALSKEKECESLSPWIRSIVNHLYWCPASSPPGDTDLILDKWRSVTNHVQNIHRGHGERFDKCQHPLEGNDAPKRKWLKSGSKVAEKLGMLLENPRLLRDVKKLSPMHQTSSVESFHSVIITFAPKMISFSYPGMLSRLYLSALHFNENSCREQAVDQNGELKFRTQYKKYKKGQHMVAKVTCPMTFNYVDKLLGEVSKLAETKKTERATPEARVIPPPLTSHFPRVDLKKAVADHLSRFNKM